MTGASTSCRRSSSSRDSPWDSSRGGASLLRRPDSSRGWRACSPRRSSSGVARAISVVLSDGQVLDTILYALATPLGRLPGLAAAMLMVPTHALLHVPVPSVSGHAVLTMPVMAPLCDLLEISRDAGVIAYQTGAGLMDMITPTNGALLAMLLAADVPYGRWIRFAVPGALLVAIVGLVGIALAR